ncbi:DcrB-related protein [Erwinia sp. BNK-24-b]|uniref:DcrB-related protein n=1 Tax=Erwinia TaxID=551 RepID=UPI001FEDF409|nr:DcrB-related protein [Erwinia phyllosphaerae]MBV4367423.1 DcrB-related protein [Erwinia phyllosphaerae]
MSKKQPYIIYEGNFLTEAPNYDQSINVLRFLEPDGEEYSIMVNRSFKVQDQTLEAFCENQMNFLANTLPGYENEGKMLHNQLGPEKLPVIQIANSFLDNGQRIRQVQSFVELPYHPVINPSRLNLIIFSLIAQKEFTEYQRKHYVQIINSFTPETKAL